MLLHNQRGASVSWQANGDVFEWEPYGACEVPDILVEHIKAEGFPVGINPVAPKERADRAAAQASESEQAAALSQARKDLERAQTQLRDALATAEASDRRANAAQAEVDGLTAKLRTAEQESERLRKDATVYEKLLAEAGTEATKLKEQLRLEQAKSAVTPAEPAKKK